jgi:hypothetical protein
MDEIKLLHQRKIRQQLRFLQLELEETKVIYKKSLETFNSDFRKYITGDNVNTQKEQKVPEDENLKIKSEVEEDTFKSVYRKVAGKTHPDKGGDTDKFKKANEANRNKDLGALMDMADELGIEVPMDDKLAQEMKKQIDAIVGTIKNIKITMAWTWTHTPRDKREDLKNYILHQLQML